MKLLLGTSRLGEKSLFEKDYALGSETSRVLRIIYKRVLFLSFSFSCLAPSSFTLLYFTPLYLSYFFSFYPFPLLSTLAFLLSCPCEIIVLLFQRGFFENVRRSMKIHGE